MDKLCGNRHAFADGSAAHCDLESDHGGKLHIDIRLDCSWATFSDAAASLVEIDVVRSQIESIRLRAENARLWVEINRLNLLINSPQTADFMEAVRVESAHQVERWGPAHDAGKRPEDWVTLVVYLLGKASRAHFDGDRDKLLHHVITLGAVALNWHRNMMGEGVVVRPGAGSAGED